MKKQFISEESLRAQQSEIVAELEGQLKDQVSLLANYKKEHGRLEVLFNRLESAVKPIKQLPVLYTPAGKSKVDSPCSTVVELSDWHYGARVVSAEIENFNEYDIDICKERAMNLAARVVKWTEVKRSGYNIPDLHIVCLGDFISGDIHDELRRTNILTVPEQSIGVAGLLARMIGSISPYFDKIIVHFLVADNHGRLTKKPQANEEGKNHYNFIVGHHAKSLLRDHDNVDFRIYEVHERVIDIRNMQYLIMHGHGIPQHFGVPWYAIERRQGRESSIRLQEILNDSDVLRRAKEIGFNKLKHAHFHVPFNHWLYSCNGTLEGTSAYDHQFGRHAPPIQVAYVVHPSHGEFDRTEFVL